MRPRRHLRILVLVDVLVISLSLVVALSLGWGGSDFVAAGYERLLVVTLVVFLWPVMLWKLQSRQSAILGDGPEEYRRVFLSGLWTAVLAAGLAFFLGATHGRGFLLAVAVLGTGLLLASRHIMRRWLRRRLQRGPAFHRVFVVAGPESQKHIANELAGTDGLFEPVGFLDSCAEPDVTPEEVVDRATLSNADTLLYAPSNESDPTWARKLAWALEATDLTFFIEPSLSQVAEPRLSIQPVEGLPLVRVEMPRFSGPARLIKRLIDLFGSLFLLAVLAIPLLLIGLIIRLESRGGALYTQTRIGRDGVGFKCFKFRTMCAGADKQREDLREAQGGDSATFKMTKDPRVTRVGHILRRYSLDEFPQLLNVVRGEMSLVGPRPHPKDDVDLYHKDDHRRHLAKPGMTGLWQVSGRSDLDWEESVALDLYYVENWSLTMDFLIFLRTAKAVLSGKGAY
ncbi:MAG: sugar transferase [Actinomycetia bacterium]|nr:sugar transferase [Actinomycetes bacterium]